MKGLIEVPEKVKGFELEKEDSEMMRKLYPPGHEAALKVGPRSSPLIRQTLAID